VILYRLFVRGHLQEVDDGISDVFSFFWSDSIVHREMEGCENRNSLGPLVFARSLVTKKDKDIPAEHEVPMDSFLGVSITRH